MSFFDRLTGRAKDSVPNLIAPLSPFSRVMDAETGEPRCVAHFAETHTLSPAMRDLALSIALVAEETQKEGFAVDSASFSNMGGPEIIARKSGHTVGIFVRCCRFPREGADWNTAEVASLRDKGNKGGFIVLMASVSLMPADDGDDETASNFFANYRGLLRPH